MQAEYLQGWLDAAMQERNPAMEHWEQILELAQTAFRDGTLPAKCAWQTVVPLLKGNCEYRGIGLVKVLWKSIPGLINWKVWARILYILGREGADWRMLGKL